MAFYISDQQLPWTGSPIGLEKLNQISIQNLSVEILEKLRMSHSFNSFLGV